MVGAAATDEFDAVEQAVVDHVFRLQPGLAVGLGLHQYDGIVPDLSAAATDRWEADADVLLGRLAGFDEAALPAGRRADRFLLRLLLEGPLFDLRESRDLERNPMTYIGGISLTAYLVRDYAPAADRVRAMVRTLSGVPKLLEDGRRRLRGPLPRPFVDLALAIGSGLPGHFAEAEAYAARVGAAAEFAGPRAVAEAAVAHFVAALRDELPRAVPDFALGPERFQRLLFVREGLTTPVDELRRAGEADLARNQARLAELLRQHGTTEAALLERMGDDHPAAAEIVPAARRCVDEALAFVRSHDLVSVPAGVAVRVEETPLWARALSTASMDSPGPFDPGGEGVYYVTPVDPAWSAAQQREWLRSLNRTMLANITVHEVFPGHYLQYLHLRAAALPLARRVYLSPSFVEGWAHYTEELAVENGFGGPGPEAEVAQLHDALLRDCRLLAAVGLHADGWPLERAVRLFETDARMDRLPAEREAIRGTYNPEYFCYTLGKLAIRDLRARRLASSFGGNPKAFHDALLGLGAPPIALLDALLDRPGGGTPGA